MTSPLPMRALSVRQPWAWAIMHARKDIENRTWRRLDFRGRVAIHASASMTRDEYDNASRFIRWLAGDCPAPDELVRGAIVGSVDVVDMVRESESKWFFGPVGLVLRDAEPIEPIPAVGQLGFFKWEPLPGGTIAAPAKWMLPQRPAIARPAALPLFEEPRQ